ncbi:GntR family transcriptional regulator [Sporosarcina sp. FSL K6-2383]|uniref:GntR family transcriptional regulator n=1 Tax=Sporosarcina sp. FSL K6-2383 TaxID=2921556 RepID=UPI00315B09C2
MQILISNSSKEPIYAQIYVQIKKLILTGELQEGESLPSMRQLAKDLEISVITTKRAYEELEKSSFIYSIVGKGSFVAEQNMEMMKERKMNVIEEQMLIAIQNGKEMGLSLVELKEILTVLYKEDD